MKKILYVFVVIVVALFASCKEDSGEANEFENWQQRNDQYFNTVYQEARQAASSGDDSWKVINSYSKDAASAKPTDYIVAKVLAKGEGTVAPLFTDSVSIHYRGYLMPSDSYNTKVEGYPHPVGYQFDSSWTGDYCLPLMLPLNARPNDFVNGFATALQQMHDGDRWLVYLPYALGYGSTEKTSVPAYSTLIFEITMQKSWKKRL